MFAEGLTYQKTITMVTVACCNCGCVFGMPSDLDSAFQQDSDKYFYCPNGHRQHYSKSTETKLREQLQQEKDKAWRIQQDLERQVENEQLAKKKVERQLKRIHRGVCPCCNRTFHNIQRHMETRHPEIVKAKEKDKFNDKITNKK